MVADPAAGGGVGSNLHEDDILQALFQDAPWFRYAPRTRLEAKEVEEIEPEQKEEIEPDVRPPDWRLNNDFLLSEVRKMNSSQSARHACVQQKEESENLRKQQQSLRVQLAREKPPRTAWAAPTRPDLPRKSKARIKLLRQRAATNRLALPPQHAHRVCHPEVHSKSKLLKYPAMVSAIHRLGQAASTFSYGGTNTEQMNASFKRGDLSPTDLHRAVHQCFGVTLTPDELGAVVSEDGLVWLFCFIFFVH